MLKRLECPVCYATYNLKEQHPRLLSCFHTLCQSCIKTLSQNAAVVCPLCKRSTSMGGSSGKEAVLPSNFALCDMIEELALFALPRPSPSGVKTNKLPVESCKPTCGICSDGETASHRCVECATWLCKPHAKLHPKEAGRQTHSVQTLDELKALPAAGFRSTCSKGKTIRCCKHPDQVVDLFCVEDAIPVCPRCAVADHHGHKIQDASAAFPAHKVELVQTVKRVRERRDTVLRGIETIRSASTAVATAESEALRKLDTEHQRLLSAIQQRHQSLRNEINAAAHTRQKLLEQQKSDLEMEAASAASLADHVELMLQVESDVRLLQIKKEAMKALIAAGTGSDDVISAVEAADFQFEAPTCRSELVGDLRCRPRMPWPLPVLQTQGVVDQAAQSHLNSVAWNQPTGLASDAKYLYVANLGNSTVTVLDKQKHRVVTQLSSTPTSSTSKLGTAFGQLYGICTDGLHLYIADEGSRTIHVFSTKDWSLLRSIPSKQLVGVAVDVKNIFALDQTSKLVHVLDKATGAVMRTISSPGTTEGCLTDPCGIAIDNTMVYVADAGIHRVLMFDKCEGKYLRCIGTGQPGGKPGELREPRRVAVDAEHVYVSDSGNNRIQVFRKADGSFVRTFGSQGTGPAQFHGLRGVTVDEKRLYATDYSNLCPRVQAFL